MIRSNGTGRVHVDAMLMAEELEVGLTRSSSSTLRPTTSSRNPLFGDQKRVDRRRCARSTAVATRRATGRTMLLGAAAQTWDVDPASCRPSGRSDPHAERPYTQYGALARKSGQTAVPEKVALRIRRTSP